MTSDTPAISLTSLSDIFSGRGNSCSCYYIRPDMRTTISIINWSFEEDSMKWLRDGVVTGGLMSADPISGLELKMNVVSLTSLYEWILFGLQQLSGIYCLGLKGKMFLSSLHFEIFSVLTHCTGLEPEEAAVSQLNKSVDSVRSWCRVISKHYLPCKFIPAWSTRNFSFSPDNFLNDGSDESLTLILQHFLQIIILKYHNESFSILQRLVLTPVRRKLSSSLSI